MLLCASLWARLPCHVLSSYVFSCPKDRIWQADLKSRGLIFFRIDCKKI